MNKKLQKALYKVLAADVYDFKTGKKLQNTVMTIDWNKAKIYPVSGTDMKILAVELTGSIKRIMLSLIPVQTKIKFQVDEIGGELSRELATIPPEQTENYIKTKLVTDINNKLASKLDVAKISQKLSPKLSTMLESMQLKNIA